MTKLSQIIYEKADPNPEYLIKSIAEQGYSLETSLADLMDNSISANANKIEVIIDTEKEPFKLFLADNGNGMNEEELSKNMQFPSSSPDSERAVDDLGRFGLGLKTASFSQTRCFTVISRKNGEEKYHARTWDVEFLKTNGWKIIVNTEDEIEILLKQYKTLSQQCLNQFDSFSANTIVVWKGLYKFENYLKVENRKSALQKELNEITVDYLSLVFHRFMESKVSPLQIRVNNQLISPFDPFPILKEKDLRQMEPMQSMFRSDVIKIEGFVLPSRAIKEAQKGLSHWTTRYKGLMEMEGLYIYRADRIILFGGWNGLIKKAPRLQLARLRVEVGNGVDHLLHLNVAKSQIVVPHELRSAFENYIEDLKIQAEREYYNTGQRKFSGTKEENNVQLFERLNSSKGSLLELNSNFPLIKSLHKELNKKQQIKLNLLLRMINTRMNSIRRVHEEKEFIGIEEKDGIKEDDLIKSINELINSGIPKSMIKEEIVPHLGFKYASLPIEIKSLLQN